MTAERLDFGGRLRAAREARGLSLRDVAAATKISVLVLEALERNDVSRLPGGLFSRAFVRSYAREVGLDPEETVREFAERVAEDSDSTRVPEPVRMRPARRDLDEGGSRSGLRWLGLVITLLLVVVWIGVDRYYDRAVQWSTRPAPSAPRQRVASVPVPPPPSQAQPVADGGAQQAALPAQTPAAPLATQTSPSAPPAATPNAAAGQPAPSPATPNPVQTPSTPGQMPGQAPQAPGPDPSLPLQIVLNPTAPCWVSAKVDGNRIVGRTVQPGERLHLSAANTVVLTAGDAAALAYTVNDAPGRSLGSAGQVVTVVINTGNYKTFMTGRQ